MRVKELEWEEPYQDRDYIAITTEPILNGLGYYEIWLRENWWTIEFNGKAIRGCVDTEDEAKQIAQDHFNNLIKGVVHDDNGS